MEDILPALPEEIIAPPKPTLLQQVKSTLPVAVPVVILVLAGLALWLRPRRRPLAGAVDAALAELAAVDRQRNQVDAARLAEQAADVVRRFMAARHGLAAPKRTSEELLQSLAWARSGALAEQRPLLRHFLESCDRAKFAGAEFNAAERLALLEAADKFIREAGRNLPPPLPPAVQPSVTATSPSPPAAPSES